MSISLGLFFGILTLFAWGAHKIFAGILVKRIGAYSGLVCTNSILVLIVFAYCIATKTFAVPSAPTFAIILSIAALGAIAVFSLYKSMEIGKLSVVVPVSHSYSAFIVLFALLFFGETMPGLKFAAVGLTIFGVLLISFRISELKKLSIRHAYNGVGYAAATALLWGFVYSFMKPVVSELGVFSASLYFEPLVLFFILIPMIAGKQKFRMPKGKYAAVALLSGLCVTIGAIAYNAGVSLELVSIVGPISAASLMVTVILSRIFLGERVETNQKIGIALVLAGIIALAI